MNTALIIIIIFSIIGLLDTSYLIIKKLQGKEVRCIFFPKEWCHKVTYSKQSKTFGIPNSYLGFAMYVGILVLVLLASGGTLSVLIPFALIWFGFLFSLYFLYIQAFVLHAFCTWCVISAINFLVMTVTSLIHLL